MIKEEVRKILKRAIEDGLGVEVEDVYLPRMSLLERNSLVVAGFGKPVGLNSSRFA